jgi:glutathione S-transferase
MYKLYGDLGSGSATVELTLAELGVPYEFCNVPLESDSQRSADFANLNPQKKVPALVCPDGSVITESVAIILWLLESHSEKQLLPVCGSPERARALRWLLFVTADLYQLIEIIDYPERFAPDQSDAQSLRDKTTGIWQQRWKIVEDNVAGPFLLGESFCVTDIYIAVVSRWAKQDQWRPQNIPNVEAIANAVSLRPACRDIWKRNFSP